MDRPLGKAGLLLPGFRLRFKSYARHANEDDTYFRKWSVFFTPSIALIIRRISSRFICISFKKRLMVRSREAS